MTVETLGYAGDLSPADGWALLAAGRPAVLIDVRTRPEWSFVGTPDLGALGTAPLLVEWQSWPDMARDAGGFVATTERKLVEAGVPKDAALLFLCRSGARSREAAIAMTAAGWTAAYNIAGGFEGPLDASGHRGTVEGWKASGLPWRQG